MDGEKIIKLTVERNIIFGLADSEKFAWFVENINEFPGCSLRLPWIQLSLSADRLLGRTGSQREKWVEILNLLKA